jgi:hypothetical protein
VAGGLSEKGLAMPVDTRGFRDDHIGKRLRVELQNGEVDDINLLELTICEEPEPCCGITYILNSARPSTVEKENGGVYWTAFEAIRNFQVIGD